MQRAMVARRVPEALGHDSGAGAGRASASNSGSTDVPSRNDITNSGGISGGSPPSSKSDLGHRHRRRTAARE